MGVVAVVSILVAIAAFSVRKYIYASKTGEAVMMLGSIKAGQEAFREETERYFNVSNSNLSENVHPIPLSELANKNKVHWEGHNTATARNFYALQITADAPVQYTYGCIAGSATQDPPTSLAGSPPIAAPTWPNSPPGEVWYVAQAIGDLDGDGVQGAFATSSFSTEIWVERDGE
jgi:Tfp pilus assembly protein PilE